MPALRAAIIVAFCLGVIAPAQSCEIPVYHYALENWESDPWEVLVFHRGTLSASEREAVSLLRAGADHRTGHANLLVRTVDIGANPDAIMMQRWGEQGTSQLPWVAAYYPQVRRIARPAWAGPLRSADMRALLDSPLRQKIAGELASRITAAWVLLESGDRGKDNAAATLLERELRRLEQTLVLPVLEGWGPSGAPSEPENVKFTLHRLNRSSSDERMLVNMLLHSEPDLTTEFAREPLVFPIYGRGLILYALAGAGINEWTISQAADFLTGPCSCEVKASNPGTDMLVALDWNSVVRQTARERLPAPTGMASFQDRAAEAERRLAEAGVLTDAAGSETASAAPSRSRGFVESTQAGPGATRSTPPRTLDSPAQTQNPASATTPGRTDRVAPPSAATRPSAADRSSRSDRLARAPWPTLPPPPQMPRPPRPGAQPPPGAEAQPAGEPLGPPDPAQIAGLTGDLFGDDEFDIEPFDELQIDHSFEDQDAMAAATTRGDVDPTRGVARLLGILALIAAVATALITVIVIRSRKHILKGDRHEHIST